MRRDFEPFAAGFARQQVIHSHHVIADFAEQRAIAFGRTGRQTILLRPPHPANLILVAPLAARAGEGRRQGFRTFDEKVSFFHELIIAVAISLQPSAFSHQPSAISHQPSAISLQPSAISHQPSAISHQPSAFGHQPSALNM
jgi:hypothetical protein